MDAARGQTPAPTSIILPYGATCWYYIDTQGVTQGPFSDLQMRNWHNNGYFTDDLQMKRGLDESSGFTALRDIFFDLAANLALK